MNALQTARFILAFFFCIVLIEPTEKGGQEYTLAHKHTILSTLREDLLLLLTYITLL